MVFDNLSLNMVKEETKTIILENTTAQKIEIHTDYVLVTTHDGTVLKAKIVVGCDGAHSIVHSALTHTRELLTETCPSLRGYYKNVKDIEQDCLEIHLLSRIPKGYFWIFPSTDGLANFGIGADKDVVAKHKINMRKEFQSIMDEEPQFKERFANAKLIGEIKGWTIPIGYFSSKLSISGARVLLCGDAAALVDPAMSSGRYAAWQIKKCFKENNFSAEFMKGYDQEIYNKYARNYKMKSTITNLYYKFPFLMNWAVFIAGNLNRLRNKNQL